MHRYLYSYANPTTYVDPDGRIVWVPILLYIAYTAGHATVDTAGDVAMDETVNAMTGTKSTTTATSTAKTFGENFAGDLLTAGVYGKAKKVKRVVQIAEAAEKVYDNSKTVQKVEKAAEKVADKVDDSLGAAKDKVKKSLTSEKADGPVGGSPKKPDVSDSAAKNKVEWKDENASKSKRAQNYEDSAPGARSSVETKAQQAPTLKYKNKNPKGRNEVRFDGEDADTGELIDRKINIAGSKKARNQVLRQADAARQNDKKIRWEVPDEKVQRKAEKLVEKQNAEDVISVKVVPENEL